MKKSVILLLLVLVSVSFVAAECDLDAELINQDPYPAQPGEVVKVVFQLTGVEDSSCGKVRFSLVEEYPFSLDPGARNTVEINSGTFVSGFRSYLLVPYDLRVDADAVEGENSIGVLYSSGSQVGSSIKEEFNITVEDSRTEFEVHISDYDATNGALILEVLNVGESDVDAVTLEINGENIKLSGSSRSIIGEIDSNEEETVKFEGEFLEGIINIKIIYTDKIGERRAIDTSVSFDPARFPGPENGSFLSVGNSFIIGLLIPIVIYFFYNRSKKKKERHKKRVARGNHGFS